MSRFLQFLVSGLGNGSAYALIALGFVIIYKSTKIISFAQPALMVVGATAVAFLGPIYGLPFPVAVLAGMALAALVGVVVERTALRPMVGKPVFVVAIITIGVDIVLRTIVNRFLGIQLRPTGPPRGAAGCPGSG